MSSQMRTLLRTRSLLTTFVFAILAFGMSAFCRDYSGKAAVPVTFLLALIPALLIAGRMASLLVAVVASLIFAMFLFEPYGSLAIRSTVDRIELFCFVLAALGVVLFAPDSAPFDNKRGSIESSGRLENWIAVAGYTFVFMALLTLLLRVWNSMLYQSAHPSHHTSPTGELSPSNVSTGTVPFSAARVLNRRERQETRIPSDLQRFDVQAILECPMFGVCERNVPHYDVATFR